MERGRIQGLPNFFEYPLLSQERVTLQTSTFVRTFLASIGTKVHYKFLENKSPGLHFAADNIGLSSFKFVQWAPKDGSFLRRIAFWPFKVVQGHPRSMILVLIESACTTSY